MSIRLVLTVLLMAAGIVVCAIGVRGIFRFRYAANRMHAAAINDTMGIALCMIGLAISAPDLLTALKILLVIPFFWVTAPVASHLLCRLEVETNEDRENYMTVHERTLNEEREDVQSPAAEEGEE
jgi:multicomponent Na+:H+ antiporter subunit G